MALELYNTLTRKKQRFEPYQADRVTMYLCGPTVYSYAHIGNARPAVIVDLLYRLLQRQYSEVIYARNITDVDDKINQAAFELQVPISEITRKFAAVYRQDMAALDILPPTIEPHATEHMSHIITMIESLIAGGHAYVEQKHVLFAVNSFAEYGALSGRDQRELIAGARIEVAPYKHNPGDFVLWKPSDETQPGWDSPWGNGRPGWHIECSAMAEHHLGETIDIHAGGQDLIFPHHENEIAQSVCAHNGQPFARYWLHNGFVTVDKRKMSKSLNNTVVMHDLLQNYPGEVLRYLLMSAHYRQPLDWSESALKQIQRTLNRMYAVLRDSQQKWASSDISSVSPPAALTAALEDDINTPKALAVLNQSLRDLANADSAETAAALHGEIKASANLLGVLKQSPQDWFDAQNTDTSVDTEQVESLIALRYQARADKDFAAADDIRNQLTAMGVQIEDGPDGTRWRVVSSVAE